jgi:hypothetical protein
MSRHKAKKIDVIQRQTIKPLVIHINRQTEPA